MSTLLVSYDLQAPDKDYKKLWEHLKSYKGWAKPLESFWLIKTSSTPKQIRDLIRDYYVDRNDKIFVVDVTDRTAAWNNLSDKISDWIKNNL